ncbi:MAG: glycosyltransferase 61 family protein [Pseudomonadota bacterium]
MGIIPAKFWPYTNALRGKLRPRPDFDAVAEEIEILAPAEPAQPRRRALLPGMVDRIQKVVDMADPVRTLANVEAEHTPHMATRRLLLRDVLLLPRGISTRGGNLNWSDSVKRYQPTPGPLPELDEAYYLETHQGYRFFAHWLVGLATHQYVPPGATAFHRGNARWPHMALYRAVTGLGSAEQDVALVRRLQVIDELGFGTQRRRQMARMRARVHRWLADPSTAGDETAPDPATLARIGAGLAGRRVYLRRVNDGNFRREVADEEALCEALAREGFDIVDPATLDGEGVLRRLAGAAITVTIEGSHAAHCSFALPPGALLIPLIPCDRFTAINAVRAEAMDCQAGLVVVERAADGGYRVWLDDILRTIDLALTLR